MTDQPPNYRRFFWKSRHHLWLALLSLGLGFATGEPLGLLAGATLYAIGLVFMPDSRVFRRSVDKRLEAKRTAEEAAVLAAFRQQQAQLLSALSPVRRQRHEQLAGVCRDIEAASAEAQFTTGLDAQSGLRKLDELMWTYLRMLSIEQSLDVYLETERKEDVPALVRSLEAETAALSADIERERSKTAPNSSEDPRERLVASHLERLAALRQRLTRIEQARANLTLVRSEQERLVEQVKLIRAEAVAAKNADALSARIDLSIAHLAATNQWLSELSEFKDLTQQIPDLPQRVGIPAPSATTRRQATRQQS